MTKTVLVVLGLPAVAAWLGLVAHRSRRVAPAERTKRCSRLVLVSLAATAAVTGVAYTLVDDLVHAVYVDGAITILGRVVFASGDSEDFMIQQLSIVLARLFFVSVLGHVAILAWGWRPQVTRRLHRFFGAAGDPVNLAVFRVVLFASMLHLFDLPRYAWYGALPHELIVPPAGLASLLHHVPITPPLAWGVGCLFQIACVAAMVGLATRLSTTLAVVTGLYVLGLPQVYGKVDHYHHLLWFAAIVAASPAGAALSVDALLRAWRRGHVEPRHPARAYAVPLRLVWVLMGVIYFFPGFWKLWNAGFEWIFTENLRLILHAKWSEFPAWRPVFRVDRYPLIYMSAAAGTVLFELSFLWLVFFRRLRAWLVVAGLGFHNASGVFMRIWFVHLQTMYVSFVDWARLFRWLGARLFREPLRVYYDGGCGLCRRSIAIVAAGDVLGRVVYVDALGADDAELPSSVDRGALLRAMHAVSGDRCWTGFDAWRALAARVPFLWPLLSVLYLPGVAPAGRRLYARIAARRRCSVAPAAPRPAGRLTARPVVAVGAVLLVLNAACGAARLDAAWPFACYPQFDNLRVLRPQTAALLEMGVRRPTGEFVPLDPGVLGERMYVARFRGLVQDILRTRDAEDRRTRFRALWSVWAANTPTPLPRGAVEVYRTIVPIDGARGLAAPVRRELVQVFTIDPR
jgi:predicted DCC family thiol-disulfide oxidoreductase YuxK